MLPRNPFQTSAPRTIPSALILAAVGFLAVATAPRAASQETRRPNVLLIMADDMGWGDVRSHGNDKIDTPVLDRLAASGARFDRFYVSPVCAPTRASLLTGRYHLRTYTSWVTGGRETMQAVEVTLAEGMRQSGYRTGLFGKWHNGAHYPMDPNGQGFDEFLGFCAGHWNNYFDTRLQKNREWVQTKGYITDVLTDGAMEFIRQHRSEPFLCYVPYNAPHGPFQVPDGYFDKYKQRGLDDKTASVYGMVENIDDNVGRLLKQLDDLKLAENTIVLFLTDNGPNGVRFNGGMKGTKGSVHEGGVRVPLFVRWPGQIRPGTVVQETTAHIDLLPTLNDLCGIEPRGSLPIDGRSLAPLLRGSTQGWPDRLLFTHQSRRGSVEPTPGSVRSRQYRLANTGKGWELYDMLSDPGQKQDLSARKPEVVSRLREAYETWFSDVTEGGFERIPTPVGYPQALTVELPAPEAQFSGGLHFFGKSGWANDWITGWTNPADTISWSLDVVRPGKYEVTVLYTCPPGSTGARIEAETSDHKTVAVLREAHDPKPKPSPDRVPRGEVYEKEWGRLKLGTLEMKRGRTPLVLRALSKPGKVVMDVKGVVLTQVEEK